MARAGPGPSLVQQFRTLWVMSRALLKGMGEEERREVVGQVLEDLDRWTEDTSNKPAVTTEPQKTSKTESFDEEMYTVPYKNMSKPEISTKEPPKTPETENKSSGSFTLLKKSTTLEEPPRIPKTENLSRDISFGCVAKVGIGLGQDRSEGQKTGGRGRPPGFRNRAKGNMVGLPRGQARQEDGHPTQIGAQQLDLLKDNAENVDARTTLTENVGTARNFLFKESDVDLLKDEEILPEDLDLLRDEEGEDDTSEDTLGQMSSGLVKTEPPEIVKQEAVEDVLESTESLEDVVEESTESVVLRLAAGLHMMREKGLQAHPAYTQVTNWIG